MGRSASELARQHTERAIATLAEVMDDPFEEAKDRIRAAESLLERGHGKAAQAVIAIPADRRVAAALAAMSDEELTRIINDAPLPRLRHEGAIDAEYSAVPAKDPLLE